MKLSTALKIRSLAMESAKEMDDVTASEMPELFPRLKGNGRLVKAGTRICWNGKLMKAAADLWDREENNPDNAPALWENLNYVDGIREIPEVITAGQAFSKGEKGIWKGVVYESLYDANVWNPEQFAAGWKKIE